MKLSTVGLIFWIAFATFWSLLILDWVTPGKAPALLDIIEELGLGTMIAAQFYYWGAARKTTTTTEASN